MPSQPDELEVKRQNRFDDGYLEGKDLARYDLQNRCVDTKWFRIHREINNTHAMGVEIGYLRELLWVLTKGQIT